METIINPKEAKFNIVATLIGKAFIINKNGEICECQEGDKLFEGDIVQTDENSSLSILLPGGGHIMVGRSSSHLVEFTDQTNDIDEAQRLIAEGADPTKVLEASAAGPTTIDDHRHGYVVVDYGTKGSVGSGFETSHVTSGYETNPVHNLVPSIEIAKSEMKVTVALDKHIETLVANTVKLASEAIGKDPDGWDKPMTDEEHKEFIKPGVTEGSKDTVNDKTVTNILDVVTKDEIPIVENKPVETVKEDVITEKDVIDKGDNEIDLPGKSEDSNGKKEDAATRDSNAEGKGNSDKEFVYVDHGKSSVLDDIEHGHHNG